MRNFEITNGVISHLTYSESDPNPGLTSSLRALQGECFFMLEYVNASDPDIYELPCYPENISESQQGNWSDVQPLGRSSPLSAFTGTGYRIFNISLKLHREMVFGNEAYIDELLVAMRKSVYPQYTTIGLIPPTATIQFGKFRAKGFVRGVSFNWQKPIIDGMYQVCDLSLDFVDVPDEVFSANMLGRVPTNPFNRT